MSTLAASTLSLPFLARAVCATGIVLSVTVFLVPVAG